ncbi:hypothetical protein ElyMa_002405900 [Elysia marginata]|uniref:Uncharacterized protein n=1 Tax=Elysia marginata TaxID=1093978 RepID=A0AAV4GE61_9GAST|nr:hypothetical protein ElyMa_002405900 [Elysia marginata]
MHARWPVAEFAAQYNDIGALPARGAAITCRKQHGSRELTPSIERASGHRVRRLCGIKTLFQKMKDPAKPSSSTVAEQVSDSRPAHPYNNSLDVGKGKRPAKDLVNHEILRITINDTGSGFEFYR